MLSILLIISILSIISLSLSGKYGHRMIYDSKGRLSYILTNSVNRINKYDSNMILTDYDDLSIQSYYDIKLSNRFVPNIFIFDLLNLNNQQRDDIVTHKLDINVPKMSNLFEERYCIFRKVVFRGKFLMENVDEITNKCFFDLPPEYIGEVNSLVRRYIYYLTPSARTIPLNLQYAILFYNIYELLLSNNKIDIKTFEIKISALNLLDKKYSDNKIPFYEKLLEEFKLKGLIPFF